MKKYVISLLLVVALLVTAMAFTAQAEVDKNAISAGLANGTYLADLTDGCTAECPFCGTPQTWKALGATDGMTAENTHYFLSDNHTNYLESKVASCLYLNGYNITVTNSVAFGIGNANLTVMGKGTETVSGCNYADYAHIGATFDMNGSGDLYLCGGTYEKGTTSNRGPVIGLRGAEGALSIYAGTQIKGGSNSSGDYGGGSVNVTASNTAINMYGGSITGGSAMNGGNVYIAADCAFTMYDGEISGGTATSGNGGNIALCYPGTATVFTMKDGEISGGNAGNWGGNIYIEWNRVDIEDGIVTGGNAVTGGNIGVNYSYLHVTGGEISEGTATNGGNIFYESNTRGYTLENAIITGGEAATGGNIYTATPLTATGCQIAQGTATNAGANFFNEGAFTLNNCQVSEGNVYAGAAVTVNGGSVNVGTFYMANGCLTLDGAVQFSGIDLSSANASLLVKETFTGRAGVDGLVGLVPGSVNYGATLDSKYTAEGDFTGYLFISSRTTKPAIFNNGTELFIAKVYTVDGGNRTWFKNNAAAVAGYGEADYLVPDAGALELAGGNYAVDLAGQNVAISGSGNVTVFDSANADYTTFGTATVTGATLVNQFETVAADGNTYYMVEDNGAYSFHRLSLRISGVSIRPSTAGIYYKATWVCDEKLEGVINTFGVAVSLDEQPGKNFAENSLYTEFDKSEFESGEAKTSVIIENIFKENIATGEISNAERGEMHIYATAYVVFQDGTTAVSNDNVSHSMRTVMEKLDEVAYEANADALESFYMKWEDAMSGWDFEKIGK